MIGRAAAGFALAAVIVCVAWRARSLSRSGAAAALVVGTLSAAASWGWAVLLIWFFVTSSALTHWQASVKAARTASVLEKGGARDAVQVLANGAFFAFSGAIALAGGQPGWQMFGLGSLASAAADTFATEVGTALHSTPRFILSGQVVAAGTSGAMSVIGTVASFAGAAAIAIPAFALGWSGTAVLAVAAGGVVGSLADTFLGATLQERRWCGACQSPTERHRHRCGAATARSGGIAGFGNDAVNLTSSALGGLAALALAASLA